MFHAVTLGQALRGTAVVVPVVCSALFLSFVIPLMLAFELIRASKLGAGVDPAETENGLSIGAIQIAGVGLVH